MIAGLNQDDNRFHNRSLVLKHIKQRPGITRTDLADLASLTKPAITKIINDCLAKGLIQENKEGASRNKGLFIVEGRFFSIAVYLGRLSITGAVYDIGGKQIMRDELPNGISFYGNDNLSYDARDLVQAMIEKSGIDPDSILAIGIAAPGAVSSSNGTIYNRSVPDLQDRSDIPFNWGKIHLVEFLKESFGVPVFLANNSNLSALAEYWFGKGFGLKTFVQYSVGIGIGAGVIINGKFFSGNDGIAVEIGHTTVDMQGERCFCGNRGCLDTIASFKKIAETYDGKKLLQNDLQLLERLKGIFLRAGEKEPKAMQILADHAAKLAIGAVTLINIFSPEKLVISFNELDGVPAGILLKDIQEHIRRNAYPIISESVEIEMSELGEDIHLLGANALILEHLYQLILDKINMEV